MNREPQTHDIPVTPYRELETRISRFQKYLQELPADGALVAQPVDLFYFTGTIQQSFLWIPASGEPVLMVRKSLERARTESGIRTIVPLSNPGKIPGILRDLGLYPYRNMGLEMDVIPAQLFLTIRDLFQPTKIVDISPEIRTIRSVKSVYEINKIRKSAAGSDRVFAYAQEILTAGMTEVELAGAIEAHARSLGHQGMVRMRLWGSELFYGHLISGPDAAVPSYLSSPTGGKGLSPAIAQGPGFRRIQPNEPVLIDYVFAADGYISDATRIFCIGNLPDDLMRAHEDMLRLQACLREVVRPGAVAGEIYDQAIAIAAEWGYADHFMGSGADRIRFIGHGVGLELDEYPFLAKGQSMAIEENMVIALEPKLIYPGKGVVGIENTHLVTREGMVPLTLFPEKVTRK